MIFANHKFCIVALLFLSGCSISMPLEEQTEYLLPPQNLDCSVEKSVNSDFFTLGEWPQQNWWEVFHFPQLNALIAEALLQNPSIQEVEARIQQSAQEAIIVRSRLFPLIYFQGVDDWQYLSSHGLYKALNPNLPSSVNLTDLKITFFYDFDFWGQNHHLFRAALGRQRAQIAEASQVRLIITTALAQEYISLKTNLLRKNLFEQLVEIQESNFDLQQLLRKKALLSRLPTLLAEEELLEAKKIIAEIDAEISLNKHLINHLIGKGPDCPLDVEPTLTPLSKSLVIPCTLSLELLARRPDLMAQIWRAEALADEVGSAIADFYPNVNLSAFVGLESTIFSFLFKGSSGTVGVKPAISLPIFTAGAIRANVLAKRAEFDQAIFAYNNLLLESTQEVTDLLALALSIFQQKEEQERIVKSAYERNELIKLRRLKGLDNLLVNFNSAAELIEKELSDVTLLYRQYIASIKLIKALGGGYISECSFLQAGDQMDGR